MHIVYARSRQGTRAQQLGACTPDHLRPAAQVAVPKYMQLRLEPASGNSMQPGARLTQEIHVTNSQQGTKALALRLRIAFSLNGVQRQEQAEVRDLPPDF